MIKLAERFNNWLESLEIRKACADRKRLLKRLKRAVMIDRTESETKRILKLQIRGLSLEFLDYIS